MTLDVAALQRHVGASRTVRDVVTVASVARLAATLDIDNPAPNAGDALPPGWHCSYFTPDMRPGGLAADGLPAETALLPPLPLPRRMFGGARLAFHAPLRVGEAIERRSELVAIEAKETRSGPLVRAVVRHTVSGPNGPAVVEEQDTLALEEAKPGARSAPPAAAPADPAWRREVEPTPTLLFRYSAITFNAHRIHYDADYTRGIEHYPGLVVQGTLLSLLLMELCRTNAPGRPLARFEFRAVRPVYSPRPFTVAGKPAGDGAELWIADPDGALAMRATAGFAAG
jgi:3-methylfumaryl-CoA hydratase